MNTVSTVVTRKLGLSDADLQELRAMFEVFDEDKNGVITRKEFHSVMETLGWQPTEAEVKRLIKKGDIDGSGTIDFEEFVILSAELFKTKSSGQDAV